MTAKNNFYSLYFFLAFINYGLLIGAANLNILFQFAIIGFLLIVHLLRHPVIKFDRDLFKPEVALSIWLIFSLVAFWNGNLLRSFGFVLNLLLMPVICHLLINAFGKGHYIGSMRRAILVLFGIVGSLYFFDIFNDGDFKGTLASSSVFGALMSLCGLFFMIEYLINKKSINIIVAITCTALLVLSSHRTGILALILSSILLPFVFSISYRAKIFMLLSLGTLFLVAIFFVIKIFPQLVSKAFYDGVIGIDNINMSGRSLIWEMLFLSWIDSLPNLIFGCGLNCSSDLIISSFPDTLEAIAVPHNEYLRLVVDLGIIGLLFYFWFLVKLLGVSLSSFEGRISLVFFIHLCVEMFFSNTIYWSGSYMMTLLLVSRINLASRRPIKPFNSEIILAQTQRYSK